MTPGCFSANLEHDAQRLPARNRLAAVVDDFLPAIPCDETPWATDDTTILVAAPGCADTAAVLTILVSRPRAGPGYDLGGRIGDRLDNWEREDRLVRYAIGEKLLFWCPVGDEGLALRSALTLGRIGALLQPQRVTLLWFAEQTLRTGRVPAAVHRKRATALAQAAVPDAMIKLHCLGWLCESFKELRHLAHMFG